MRKLVVGLILVCIMAAVAGCGSRGADAERSKPRAGGPDGAAAAQEAKSASGAGDTANALPATPNG